MNVNNPAHTRKVRIRAFFLRRNTSLHQKFSFQVSKQLNVKRGLLTTFTTLASSQHYTQE